MKTSELLRVIIGKKCDIHSSVILATPPQHLDYYREGVGNYEGKILIGDNVIIREFTNVHLPMKNDTIIGDNCFIMSHCHIAHDCVLEGGVIITTGTHLAGHTYIMQKAGLGLNCCTHQYTTIGSYAMVGMGSIITKDIPPFAVFNNQYGCYKVNKIGMIRHGFTPEEIREVEHYYLFHTEIHSDRILVEIERFHTIRNPSRKVYSVGLRIS